MAIEPRLLSDSVIYRQDLTSNNLFHTQLQTLIGTKTAELRTELRTEYNTKFTNVQTQYDYLSENGKDPVARSGLTSLTSDVVQLNKVMRAIGSSSEISLGALANLVRAIRSSMFTSNVIKLAAIGNSNGLNKDGGLAGIGNSILEIILKHLKRVLDPQGYCTWECKNFCVDGTSYSEWDSAVQENLKSPFQQVREYKPHLLVICYGTNDYAPELFNTGQTRNLISPFMLEIYKACHRAEIDIINVIPPCPHIGKSKQTRRDPVSGQLVQGRALNFSVPIQYPTRSFQIGQSTGPSDPGSFAVTFSGGNTITTSSPVFDDPSLYPGAILVIGSPTLGPITNGGEYRIKTISDDKMSITFDKVVTLSAYDYTLAGDPNFTSGANVKVSLRRIAIDPFTELKPSFTEAFSTIVVEGTEIEVITREQMVSQEVRESTASSPYSALVLDLMYPYNRARKKNGEDVYYHPNEYAHWNQFCAETVIDPAVAAFADSFVNVPAGVISYTPTFVTTLAVRPDGASFQNKSVLNVTQSVDLQIAKGDVAAVIRTPTGAIHTSFMASGGRVDHIASNGLPYKRVPLMVIDAEPEANKTVEAEVLNEHYFTGTIFGNQRGIGVQLYDVYGFCSNNVIYLDANLRRAIGEPSFTISTEGKKIKIMVSGSETQISIDLLMSPYSYGEYEYW